MKRHPARNGRLLLSALITIPLALSTTHVQNAFADDEQVVQTYALEISSSSTPTIDKGNDEFYPIKYSLLLPDSATSQDFTVQVNGKAVASGSIEVFENLKDKIRVDDEVELIWSEPYRVTSVSLYFNGPFKAGQVVFSFNQSKLTANARQVIRALAQHIGETQMKGVYLVGNADGIGTREANFVISQRRALAVKSYLQAQLDRLGISGVAITTENMADIKATGKGTKNEVDRSVSFLLHPNL